MSLVLYDVTTLYFEAEKEDELRKVGYSKERRVDPQIVVGLLVDSGGFPLEIGCFEGNKAECLDDHPDRQAVRRRAEHRHDHPTRPAWLNGESQRPQGEGRLRLGPR